MIFKEEEYQTYDDQPLDELGDQQEAPEEGAVVGGDEQQQQEEDNDTTAQDSQEFETEMVFCYSLLCLWYKFNSCFVRL